MGRPGVIFIFFKSFSSKRFSSLRGESSRSAPTRTLNPGVFSCQITSFLTGGLSPSLSVLLPGHHPRRQGRLLLSTSFSTKALGEHTGAGSRPGRGGRPPPRLGGLHGAASPAVPPQPALPQPALHLPRPAAAPQPGHPKWPWRPRRAGCGRIPAPAARPPPWTLPSPRHPNGA